MANPVRFSTGLAIAGCLILPEVGYAIFPREQNSPESKIFDANIVDRAPVAQSVEHRAEFDSGRTNTQGSNWGESAAFVIIHNPQKVRLSSLLG